MSVFLNGKKASRLFIDGKDIKKAYYNGELIFQKEQPPVDSFVTLHLVDGSTFEIETLSDYAIVNNDPNYTQDSPPFLKGYQFADRLVMVGDIVGYEVHERPDFPDYLHLFLSPNSYANYMEGYFNTAFKTPSVIVPANVRKFGMVIYNAPGSDNSMVEIDARNVNEIVNGIFPGGWNGSSTKTSLGHIILPSSFVNHYRYFVDTIRVTLAQGSSANDCHFYLTPPYGYNKITVDCLPGVTGTALLDFVGGPGEVIINLPNMDIISLSYYDYHDDTIRYARIAGSPIRITANSLTVEEFSLSYDYGDLYLYVNNLILADERMDNGYHLPAFSFAPGSFINEFKGGHAVGIVISETDTPTETVTVNVSEAIGWFNSKVASHLSNPNITEPAIGKINYVYTNQTCYDILYPLTDKSDWTTVVETSAPMVGGYGAVICREATRNDAFYANNLIIA